MEPKEAVKARLEEVRKLKEEMDEAFSKVASLLEEARRCNDTDEFWRLWSVTTEGAYHKAAGLTENEAKKNSGRGIIKLVQKTPEVKSREEDRIRNAWAYAARRNLRQARRCEQLAFRLQLKQKKRGPTPRGILLQEMGPLWRRQLTHAKKRRMMKRRPNMKH